MFVVGLRKDHICGCSQYFQDMPCVLDSLEEANALIKSMMLSTPHRRVSVPRAMEVCAPHGHRPVLGLDR